MNTIILGATLALSSTAIVMTQLDERRARNTLHGRKAFSILLFQDLAIVPLLLLAALLAPANDSLSLADSAAIHSALAAKDTYEFLGSPEGELALAQAVVHLACSPKSNAVYNAFKRAQKAARQTGSLMPPAHILNAPTKMMKEQGYGAGYEYDHDIEGGVSGQDYFPDDMPDRPVFYDPKPVGREAAIKERLERWRALRDKRRGR